MIHKCPKCRFQPVVEKMESEWFCPECGWDSEGPTKMIVEQTA